MNPHESAQARGLLKVNMVLIGGENH